MTGQKSATARLLIVDDEALIRWSLGEQLSRAGYEVAEAADGAAALDLLRTGSPVDVVVLDLKLPDIDGLRLLQQIRQVSPDSRVIMMSAFAKPQHIIDARRNGVTEIIPKPFDLHNLLRAVEQELAHH